MNTAVLSVVYPAARPYLSDFFDSVGRQTDRLFELLLVNDGVRNLDRYLERLAVKARVLKASGSPGSLRKKAIGWASKLGFDALVFADADDVMAPNRVAVSKRLLADNDLVFNELVAFGRGIKPKRLLSRRFREGERLGADALLESNCLGMSNTSVRTSCVLEAARRVRPDVRAFDWALFSRVLRGGVRAKFTARTHTRYRQHRANSASPFLNDERSIMKAAEIKAEHYSALSGLGRPYKELSVEFRVLLLRLRRDRPFRKKYCRVVREDAPADPIWWEPIKTAEAMTA